MPSHYNHPDEKFKVAPDVNPNPLTYYGTHGETTGEARNNAFATYWAARNKAAIAKGGAGEGALPLGGFNPNLPPVPAKSNTNSGISPSSGMNLFESHPMGSHGGHAWNEWTGMTDMTGVPGVPSSGGTAIVGDEGAGSASRPLWTGGEADSSKHGGTELFDRWQKNTSALGDDVIGESPGYIPKLVDNTKSSAGGTETVDDSTVGGTAAGPYTLNQFYNSTWWKDNAFVIRRGSRSLSAGGQKAREYIDGWWGTPSKELSRASFWNDVNILTRPQSSTFSADAIAMPQNEALQLVFHKYAKDFPASISQLQSWSGISLPHYATATKAGTTGNAAAKMAASAGPDSGSTPEKFMAALQAAQTSITTGMTIDENGVPSIATGENSGMNRLIKLTSMDLGIPEEYKVVTDPVTNLPVLEFQGAVVLENGKPVIDTIADPLGGTMPAYDEDNKQILNDDGTPKMVAKLIKVERRDKGAGAMSSSEIAKWNNVLQQREIAIGQVSDYSDEMLGLNIHAQKLNMVSKEFTETLHHKENELALERDKYNSNDRFTEATLTGLFRDEKGNETETLSKTELIGKLTGRMVVGDESTYDIVSGTTTSVPVMADTIELQKMRAELIGKYTDESGDMLDTITKQQFMADVTGYISRWEGDEEIRENTFARDQFEEVKTANRQEVLKDIGRIAIEGLAIVDANGIPRRDPRTQKIVLSARAKQLIASGLITEEEIESDVAYIQTLESQHNELQEALHMAKISGKAVIPMYDDNGVYIGQETVPTVEEQIRILENSRVETALDMQKAAQAHQISITDHTINEAYMNRLSEAGYILLPTFTTDAEGNQVISYETVNSLGDSNLRETLNKKVVDADIAVKKRAMGGDVELAGEDFFAPDESGGMNLSGGRFEGEDILINETRQYTTTLRKALDKISGGLVSDDEVTTVLEEALQSPLPPIPAGMVWDTNGGVLKFRAGYEGSQLTPATQRSMEIVVPALKMRDRLDAVLTGMHQFRAQEIMARQAANNATAQLKIHLEDGNIQSAEKEAFLKQQAEREMAEFEVLRAKWQMAFEVIGNPLVLGMADRHGLLDDLSSALGIVIPHVPRAGVGDAIPTYNEWSVMDSDDKQFREALWVQETGQPVDAFRKMVLGTAPAAVQQNVFSTLAYS